MKIGYDAKRIFHNWRGLGNYSRDLVLGQKKYFSNYEYFLLLLHSKVLWQKNLPMLTAIKTS